MKFGANLQTIITPEWRSQYVEYEMLKEVIYRYQERLASEEDSPEDYQRELNNLEERFFVKCDGQLSKVNNFYAEKLAEATRRHAYLHEQLEVYQDTLMSSQSKTGTLGTLKPKVGPSSFSRNPKLFFMKKDRLGVKTMKDLKFAFSEFYLSLVLLQNYQELNFTGFRKILKKHDKVLKTERGADWRKDYVETSPFYTDNLVSEYIKKTEDTYIELEDGDRSRAMKRLRVPPLTDAITYPKATVFKIGFYFGIALVLFSVFVFGAVHIEPGIDLAEILSFYRSGLVISVFCAYLGFNILGWRTYGVNHVLIFEIDPRQHLSHQHFFEISAMFAALWSLSIVSHVFCMGSNVNVAPVFPFEFGPGLMYLVILAFLLNPIPFFFHKARFWLLKRAWRLIACGFYEVEFADFWLADQLNSLVVLITDSEFMICYYAVAGNTLTTDPIGTCSPYSYAIQALTRCYPSYIRFVQCLRRYRDTKKWFPHLVNAGKYSTTFFKQTFGALYLYHRSQTNVQQSVYFFLWLASCFIGSAYTFSWDIKMDWGFLDKNAGENKFLREEIVYQPKSVYYFAIIENFIIRFFWMVVVGIEQAFGNTFGRKLVGHIGILLEITRRFIWNFFRLENEHLNNCGEFRAVRDISIIPLRKDDARQLENVVDQSDGAESQLLERRKQRLTTTTMSGEDSDIVV